MKLPSGKRNRIIYLLDIGEKPIDIARWTETTLRDVHKVKRQAHKSGKFATLILKPKEKNNKHAHSTRKDHTAPRSQTQMAKEQPRTLQRVPQTLETEKTQ